MTTQQRPRGRVFAVYYNIGTNKKIKMNVSNNSTPFNTRTIKYYTIAVDRWKSDKKT